ncbi:PepSY domain-containing protein [Ectothiorhodospira lacustris]|uniref:PepSY domain-containing protein n=1 Tax=Ectothiorhodospira lacustris TaxID=2899127 RepID=UPI001EE83D18|nr:hypothetical protein [Ectothiorhodospira lacustris]MCG5509506.1 hypothetical protein [Ectothiorhodospira lacustris]MCG5521699.1 hypothetical protein [Ectothiorhodospira lacustris]
MKTLKTIPLALLAALLIPAVGPAAETIDPQEVLQFQADHRIQPMDHVLKTSGKTAYGQILESRLEREQERYVYRVKTLGVDGVLHRMTVDAEDGHLLRHDSGMR